MSGRAARQCSASAHDTDIMGQQTGCCVLREDENGDLKSTPVLTPDGRWLTERDSSDLRRMPSYGSRRLSRLSPSGHCLDSEQYVLDHRRECTKIPGTRDLIKDGMKHDRVLSNLNDTSLDMIYKTMEYFEYAHGETIMSQGDPGSYFFVIEAGSVEIFVSGRLVNTLRRGHAFGGLALLYRCQRNATAVAQGATRLWGVSHSAFRGALDEAMKERAIENRAFIQRISMFDGLPANQKALLGEGLFTEAFAAGAQVVTEGADAMAIYFVKQGNLSVVAGALIDRKGKLKSGSVLARLGPGDSFGANTVLNGKAWTSTVIADTQCELRSLSVEHLRDSLGEFLSERLELNFIVVALRKSAVMSQFSSTQRASILEAMGTQSFAAGEVLEVELRFAVVVDGEISGTHNGQAVRISRGQWFEEDALLQTRRDSQFNTSRQGNTQHLVAGEAGARVAVLTKDVMVMLLNDMGITAIGSAKEASDYTQKMLLLGKVPLFRHISHDQLHHLIDSMVLQRYEKDAHVIVQGEMGSSFYIISYGTVEVFIDGKSVRNIGKTAYFGERALLFDEPRTATIRVTSSFAELWSIEKARFCQVLTEPLQEEFERRIKLQDTNIKAVDLHGVKIIGNGTTGVVSLVKHRRSGMRYALKRVQIRAGRKPDETAREIDILGSNDHPFVITLVKTFETKAAIYILTELITGGELHAAMRQLQTVMSRAQARFYIASLVLVLESLHDRNIVYRDLKPENVMLDANGYLRVIDFGISKRLDEDNGRTFTMIGTPHYMAPEVMLQAGYGLEVDLWSLGIMVYEFVCGCLPFGHELETPDEVCHAVLNEHLSFPREYRDLVGKDLMGELLSRRPQQRIGMGITGYSDLKKHVFFKETSMGQSDVFQKILGRELKAPLIPMGEQYAEDDPTAKVILPCDDDA